MKIEIMKQVLKDTPEYESYTENEAVLTAEELEELGIKKCGGCCKKSGGCSSKKGCCKNR